MWDILLATDEKVEQLFGSKVGPSPDGVHGEKSDKGSGALSGWKEVVMRGSKTATTILPSPQ